MKFKIALLGVLSVLSAPAYAQSGCSGQPATGYVCGNGQASTGLPGFYSQTTLLDRGFGSGQGTVINRGVSGWLATVAPSLGVNGGTGGSITLNGATSGSATISVPAVAGSVTFQLPDSNGTSNQVLSTDGSGHLTWQTLSGTGTVTSVGLSMPGIFSVTGSPVTSNGTLTASLANQSANLVWAGPSTGAAAAPTFRSLVGADLPNPSASTLGGVQSYAGVSSQWIRSISTSGVPASSQPAFSDISGSLAPSQCPASGLATLGCVNAINGTASQWLRALSTSGVFTASQPTFADIAGSATLAQLPSISNNSVLGNNSGGTAVPSSLSASNVLDMIGSTQGSVPYRGASAWAALTPGTSGQVLTSNGAGADPSWTTVAGTGTVTSVGSGTGLTGGPITTTGTLSLASIATGNVLANVSGVSAAPTANTPSSILDVIGSSTGSVLYRAAGGTGWQALAAGTNGQVLTMGASTPAWSNAGSVTNVTISAGTGISATGTCTISTSGTCTVATAAGVDTNTLNSVTANYTIQTTDCGKTIQAGTGSTGQFTVTLPAVTGFDTKCVVTIYNADKTTLAGKILSGFPTTITTGNLLLPGVFLRVKIVNGVWAAEDPGRWKNPLGQIKWYVNPSGSDSNDCLATGTSRACATAQAALTRAVYYSDNQGSTPIINMSCTGTHSSPLTMGGIPLGTQLVQISPDGNCSFDWFTGTSSPVITVGDLAELDLNLTYYGGSGSMRCQGNTTNTAFHGGCVQFHGPSVVMDMEGTPTWFPSGVNDDGFFCDGYCQPIIANGITQGAGGGGYVIHMSAGGKLTQSGTISGSAGASASGVFRVFGNAMLITTTATAAAGTWTGGVGNSIVAGNSLVVTNGLTPAGGYSLGTSAVACSALTSNTC